MPNDQSNLLYDIRSLGASQVIKDLREINALFVEIKKNKQLLAVLKSGLGTETTEDIKKLNGQLSELAKREAELSIQMKQKQVALKELQLLRVKELADQRAQVAGAKVVAGSYNDIARKYKELSVATKNGVALNSPEMDVAREKLRALKDQLDAFGRSLTKDGLLVGEYTSGIVQAFQKLGLGEVIKNQLDQAKGALTGLNSSFDQLKRQFESARQQGTGDLNAIERELIENRREAEALAGQVRNMEDAFRSSGNIGSQITASLQQSFKQLGTQIGTFIVGYVGFQQAINGLRSSISTNKQLADQMTDLQRILQVTDGTLASIVERIRGIDTRTPLTQLFDFALIAAKAGTAEKDIAGVVKAIDALQLVAGKELGSNIDQTVTAVAKLINIFEGPGKVSEQNILRYGNALVELANKGVATGEFLVDYAQRLSGIEGLTKIQIQSVLGLAAAFEEQGVSAEVAATASSQLLIKISADIPKYAAIAKQTTDAFRELVRSNPAEALLSVAEGAKGNAQFFDEFAGSLKDVGAEGARVAASFGVMGDKADFFREKIAIAADAITSTTAVTEAAAKKQQNFAATIDNIAKALEKAASSKAFQFTLQVIASLIVVILGNIPALVTALALLTAGWAAQNATLLANRLLLGLLNVQLLAYRVALGALTILQVAHAATMGLLTGAYGAGTAAVLTFARALNITPLGAILTIVGVLAGAVTALAATFTHGGEAAKKMSQEELLAAEVNKRVLDSTSDVIAKMNVYIRVINDAKTSLDVKKRALQDLIKINPEYLEGLTLQNLKTAEGVGILQTFIGLLRQKAAYEAAQSILTEKQRKDLELLQTEYDLQQKINTGKKEFNDLNEAEQKFVTERAYRSTPFAQSVVDAVAGGSAAEKALAEIKRQRRDLLKEIENTEKAVADKYAQVGGGTTGTAPTAVRTIAAIEAQIEGLTKLRKTTEIGTPAFKQYTDQLTALEDELKKLNGTYKETVSKLSVSDREAFKGIEATMNDKLTALKTAYQTQDKDQKTFNGVLIDNERAYREQEYLIVTEALRRKIATLGNANGEERRLRARFNLELLDEQKKYNDGLYTLDLDALNAERQNRENAARESLDEVEGNPRSTTVEKSAARVNFLSRMLELQQQYNEAMATLEKAYNKGSQATESERNKALTAARRAFNSSMVQLTNDGIDEELTSIESRYKNRVAAINGEMYQKLIAVMNDPGLGRGQRQRELQNVQDSFARSIFDAEIARIRARETEYSRMLKQGVIDEQEYNTEMAALNQDRYNAWKRLYDAEQGQKDREREKERQAQQALTNIYNTFSQGYIQNLTDQAEATYSKSLAIADSEKAARLEKATSEAEKSAIEQEYEQRKAELEKDRARERKRILLAQLALEFGLASIKAINAGFDAGGVPGAVAAELYVALEYAAKLAIMQAAQFGNGGMLAKGGILGGKYHGQGGTPFTWNGTPYEAERGEVMMIMNRRATANSGQYSVSGTPAQITSALNTIGGGNNFAPGGVMSRFEYGGSLGAGLTAPAMVNSGGISGLSDLRDMVALQYQSLSALAKTVLSMRVHLDTGAAAKRMAQDYAADKLADL